MYEIIHPSGLPFFVIIIIIDINILKLLRTFALHFSRTTTQCGVAPFHFWSFQRQQRQPFMALNGKAFCTQEGGGSDKCCANFRISFE